MKTKLSLILLSAGLLLAGCSTVDSRIAKNRAAFNTWPADVQDKVVAGKIGVGFTPEQVRVALGAPDWMWSRTSADGTSQIWSWRDRGPRFGFGVGVGGYGRGSAYGMGVSTATGGYRGERLRVTFDASGRVSQIEEVAR